MLLKVKIILLSLMLVLLTPCHSTMAYCVTGSKTPFLGTQNIFTMPVPDSPEDPATVCDKTAWYTIKVVYLPFTLVADCFWWPFSLYHNARYEKEKKKKKLKEKSSNQENDIEPSSEEIQNQE